MKVFSRRSLRYLFILFSFIFWWNYQPGFTHYLIGLFVGLHIITLLIEMYEDILKAKNSRFENKIILTICCFTYQLVPVGIIAGIMKAKLIENPEQKNNWDFVFMLIAASLIIGLFHLIYLRKGFLNKRKLRCKNEQLVE